MLVCENSSSGNQNLTSRIWFLLVWVLITRIYFYIMDFPEFALWFCFIIFLNGINGTVLVCSLSHSFGFFFHSVRRDI